MKAIRTKQPVTIGDRTKKQAIVAVAITEWTWQEKLNRYQAEITDFEVVDVESPDPGGTPKKQYIPILQPKVLIRTRENVDQLFNLLKMDIVQTGNFTDQYRDLLVRGLLIDTQINPIYNTAPEDWEIIDTDNEIIPTV